MEPPSILEEAEAARRACLVPLGSVLVNERGALEELQERAHALLCLQRAHLSANFEGSGCYARC